MEQVKICFCSDGFLKDDSTFINGAQVQSYLIGEELKKRKKEIYFITGTHKYKGRKIINGMNVYWYRLQKFSPLINTFEILRLLKKINPQIIYTRGRSHLVGVCSFFCWRYKKKFVWGSNAEEGIEKWKYTKRLKKKEKLKIKKLLLLPFAFLADLSYFYGIKGADEIITQTQHQKEEVMRIFKKESIIIKTGFPIPKEVETKPFPPEIVWIGSLTPYKNPEAFIKIAKSCEPLNVKFIIVGDTPIPKYKQKIMEMIKESSNIEYKGQVDFFLVGNILKRAMILINTSKGEGISNAMVEGMFYKVVPVSLRSDPDGMIRKNKIGIQEEELPKLISELKQLITNPDKCKEMGEKAKELASREYDIKKIVDKYEEVFLGCKSYIQ
jgi:glycosyltransferase involved in cell wall biosynthesis